MIEKKKQNQIHCTCIGVIKIDLSSSYQSCNCVKSYIIQEIEKEKNMRVCVWTKKYTSTNVGIQSFILNVVEVKAGIVWEYLIQLV